jgi:hypothetical protein
MKPYSLTFIAIMLSGVNAYAAVAQQSARWWMDEAIRFLQTNLRT